ncbi:MAG: hypothetical protein ACYTGX_09745 [Planctomycetota bacterium]|jgi:hypothetical protein
MSLTPNDVSNIIRASVLSDELREIGGALDAKLEAAIARVLQRVEAEIAGATESMEDGLLRAVERASGRQKAAGPTIEPALSDEFLQEIYRAAREEVASLRNDLQRQIRELARSEIAALDDARPAPLTEAQAQAIAREAAEAAVRAHAESLAEPLSEARVRELVEETLPPAPETLSEARVRELVEETLPPAPETLSEAQVRELVTELLAAAESGRAPAFGRDDAVEVAREVADAAVSVHAASQPSGLAEDDVHRIVTEFLLTQEPDDLAEADASEPEKSASTQLAEEWGEGLPEWLQVAIVQSIGNSTGVFAAQSAGVAPGEIEAAVKRALEDNPPPSAAFELSELWRDGLPSWMEAAVKRAVGERSSSGSSTGEFDEIAMRQMIIDVVRDVMPMEAPAPAPAPAGDGGGGVAGLDEPRLRMMIRGEVAEIIAELPQPPSEMEMSQLIDTAVDQALADRGDSAAAAPAPASGEPAPGETGVFVSKMRTIIEQLLDEKIQDRATHAEVDKVVTRRLEATAMQERTGDGGGDGVTLADVKRLVREIIEADELPNRAEVEKIIRRLS